MPEAPVGVKDERGTEQDKAASRMMGGGLEQQNPGEL
jgi:hypothetical protein